LGVVLEGRRPANQFLVDSVANLDRGDFDWRWRWLCVESRVANKEQTPVVVDIAPVARRPFGAIGYSHADRGLFVSGITTPVRFPANAACSVFGDATKAVDSDSLSLREVDNGGLVGIGVMD
jgi:hypothetical protein